MNSNVDQSDRRSLPILLAALIFIAFLWAPDTAQQNFDNTATESHACYLCDEIPVDSKVSVDETILPVFSLINQPSGVDTPPTSNTIGFITHFAPPHIRPPKA